MSLPRASKTVVLDGDKKATRVTAAEGQELVLQLPRVTAAGYRWRIFSHDARFLKLVTDVTPSTTGDGNSTLTFLGLRATSGRALRVRFLLVREDTTSDGNPIDSQDVSIVLEEPGADEGLKPAGKS